MQMRESLHLSWILVLIQFSQACIFCLNVWVYTNELLSIYEMFCPFWNKCNLLNLNVDLCFDSGKVAGLLISKMQHEPEWGWWGGIFTTGSFVPFSARAELNSINLFWCQFMWGNKSVWSTRWLILKFTIATGRSNKIFGAHNWKPTN